MEQRPTLMDLSIAQTQDLVVAKGGRPFHGKSLRRWVFERGVHSPEGWTDLPLALRTRLADELPVFRGSAGEQIRARDGAVKFLTHFPSKRDATGRGAVETVHLPSARRSGAATLCVSTQIGCPVKCPFCASGRDGLDRSLESGEILEQFVRGFAIGPVDRAVVMGIGEPLLNYPALERALGVVREELGLGARRITVSTVGFPERLAKIARSSPGFQLAISLHSPFDEQRARLIPLMADIPVEAVLRAGDDWFEVTGREITYEYVLLAGENDSEQHAREVANKLRGRRATVNLIPYNPSGTEAFDRPDAPSAEAFREVLIQAGIVATVRWSKGLGADAACGQLRASQLAGPAGESLTGST